VSAHLSIEGGGDSKELQIRCRQGFRRLLEKVGFRERMPRLNSCGGRQSAFDDFKLKHARRKASDYVALLVDSEDPLHDIEKTWEHLKRRDHWSPPAGAADDQVLFMTTCMETWIAADRDALKAHYGHKLQENMLPPLHNLENRDRHDVHDRLARASRNCSNAYSKGKRSFEVLAKLDPDVLKPLLPSFARVVRILDQKLRRR